MITPRQARHGRPLPSATISLVVCVAVATFHPAPAGAQSQPDDRADADPLVRPAGETLQVQERRLAAQQALNEFLIRDREFRVLLGRAEIAAAEGRTSAALDDLQSLLDAPYDVFLWPEHGGPPVSARTAAGRVLRQLPAPARACYERKHGDAARQLWEDYRHRLDPALLAELLHRFAGTHAGGEALRTLALREMDHGNMLAAAAWWQQLFSDPGLAGNISIDDRVRAQVAFELRGTPTAATLLPPDQARQTLTIAGVSRTAADWVREYVARVPPGSVTAPARLPADWTVPFGNAGARLPSTGSRPVAEPLWSVSYLPAPTAGDGGVILTTFTADTLVEPALSSAVSQWRSGRQEQRTPLAAASFPIVVGDLVVARDYSHITARDVRTGAVAWRYVCASSFQRVLAELGPDATQSPVPVSSPRSGDRPAAMFAFDAAFAENSVLGMLTSDGRRVFFIDELAADPPAAANSTAPAEQPPPMSRPATNRLLALTLGARSSAADGRPLWSVGGPLADGSAGALAGCYFLGPPIPDGDRLFILAESRHELHLIALAADTGRLLWRQPVSLVDIPIDGDPLRARLACCPAVAQGIVVCPTQLGTLVGVDAATGTLLWVYSHVEEAGPHHVGRWQHAANRRFGSAAFPDLPLIIDGRVVALPHQSEFVHCLDLQTGAGLWPPQPRNGALFAAAANRDTLLLVGARQCVGRHLHDGRLLWKTHIDSPVGRGIVAGDQYLLPTARGTVAALEIATGRTLGNLLPAPSRVTTTALRPVVDAGADRPVLDPRADDVLPLGNLCLYDDLVVSTSPLGIAAFPQVEGTLQSLLARMPTGHAAPADLLRAAELQLQLGRTAPARQLLQQALRADPPADVRAPAEDHLREVLYAELAGGDDPAAALAALDALTRDPRLRGRFLIHRLASEVNSADTAAALRTTREALQLASHRPLAMTAGGEYLAHPLRRMGALLARSGTARASGPGLGPRDTAPSPDAPHTDTAQLDLFGALPDSGLLRLRAAADDLRSGRLQTAELLLLQATLDPVPETAISAVVTLSTFWEDRGLQFEAVAALDRLSSRFGQTQLPDGATIDQHLARRLAGRKSWQICRSPATVRGTPVVTIEQVVCPEGCPASDRTCDCAALNSLFIGNREFARTSGATLCLVDRGIQPLATIDPGSPAGVGPSRAVRLAVVDRARLRQSAVIDLTPHAWRAGAIDRYDAGHLLPVVGADVYGLSLLEGRVLWSVPAEEFDPRDRPCIGPYGPEFCIVQAGGTLTALDPADGRVLWRRTDLDYDAGLVTDDETGVIGDDRAIVVFDADRITFRVFDTRSGELLRTGAIEAAPGDLRKRRWNFGRRLLFTSSANQELRLRLWDPLDDSYPVDVAARGRLLHHESCRDGLLTTLNDSRLTILDVGTNQVLWTHDLAVDVVDGVRLLNVFSDHARCYVHLERDVSQGRYSHLNGDIRVPHVQVEGELLGVDRVTGRCWNRTLPRCSLLLLPQHRLPFLVGVSRIRDGQQKQASMLMVQVLDALTGDLLAKREDLVKTSIVHTNFDPVAGRLDLAGIGSRIQIHFGDAAPAK